MFTAARIAPIAYQHPWTATLTDRLITLGSKDRRIAYFYEQPDTTIFRYRVLNMLQAVNAASDLGISASWFSRQDLSHADRFIDRADALVICRARYDASVGRMIARARARGLPVFFDVDDLIFDSEYINLVLDTSDEQYESEIVWDHWFAHVGRLGATLRACDAVIVTNQFLADRVKAFAPHLPTSIVPNFLNQAQQEVSRELYAAKKNSGWARDGKVLVGYFSGTPTHNRDFKIVANALTSLLDDNPDVSVRVVGFLEPTGPLLRHRDRIEFHPQQDFLNLQRLVSEVEVNIAPLQDNPFSNCKSELKYFEAAAVGTLTVASPTFAFRNAIRDGENGFLANAQEWDSRLRLALHAVRDSQEYARLVAAACRDAEENYSWSVHAGTIAETIFSQVAGSCPALALSSIPATANFSDK